MQVADDVDTIDADELKFKQVVLNLVTNAVKFTPDGGSVVIRASREGTELVVTVTDTGIGVPPEDQQRIFESFQQGGRGAPKEEGTGLGLTLSRRMVELFGGRMWLDSTPGVGSTFGFSVPGLPERRREDTAPKPGGFPVVVLLDEDRASQDLVEAYLDGMPTEVLRAWDGGKAFQLIRTVRPGRCRARDRAPAAGRLAGHRCAQGRPRHRRNPDHHRLYGRRSAQGAGARCGRISPQAGSPGRAGQRVAERGCPARVGGVMTPSRILVVEDNPLNLKLVRDVLQFAGYEVVEAQSGEDGLRAAQADPPDLVLMDLQLPGIDGFETLHRMRQGGLGRDVPVVAVTAFAMAEDRQRASLAGFDGFVEKPISVRALPGQVEEFLKTAGGR